MTMNARSVSCLGLAGILALSLSACGESPGCRAATGAGVGAAGGAVVGAVVAGNPVGGAVVGGAAGAAVGGLTSPNQIDGPSPCR